MAAPVGYRQFVVWQRSMELVAAVYRLTQDLPVSERFGLISQVQRAAVSIPATIAEGYGCSGRSYRHHVQIARGSLVEAEVYLKLFVTLGFIEQERIVLPWKLAQDVGAMLTRLREALSEE